MTDLTECLTCKNWIRKLGSAVPRCHLVSGTNCTYAKQTGKCRYEPMEEAK